MSDLTMTPSWPRSNVVLRNWLASSGFAVTIRSGRFAAGTTSDRMRVTFGGRFVEQVDPVDVQDVEQEQRQRRPRLPGGRVARSEPRGGDLERMRSPVRS